MRSPDSSDAACMTSFVAFFVITLLALLSIFLVSLLRRWLLQQMPKADRNTKAPFCPLKNGQCGASLGGSWPVGSSSEDIALV
jgi:hypothetical protein